MRPQSEPTMTNELATNQRDDLAEAMKSHVSRACKGATDAEVAAFCAVCRAMGLNPILGEVHAMRDKSGTLRAVPAIDGWVKVIRTQPDFRGIEFAEARDEDGSLVAITCTIHVEGWRTPCVVTEYLSECRRRTDPWQSMPTRMLRHRALIQCARVAFGLGLSDAEDVRADEPATQQHNTHAPQPRRDGLAEVKALLTTEEFIDADPVS